MLLAGFIIGMQHRSRIATPACSSAKVMMAVIAKGKRRGDNPPSASRS
jgi:hypothetical protein